MFKKKFKVFINNILSWFNLKIVNLASVYPKDLTNSDVNPLSAQYHINDNKMVMNIDLSKCRTNRWFDMSYNTLDPGIFAIRNSLKKNLKGEEFYTNILEILNKQKNLVHKYNAAKLLDIDSNDNGNIKDYPWWAAVNPWDNKTFEYELKSMPYAVKRDRAKNGHMILSNDPIEIMKEDSESYQSHARQYTDLTKRIIKNGFRYGNTYGFVTAELFVVKNKFRWKIGDEGNHRAAVAAALGIKQIPVLVTKIIRIEELEYWPNVVNGSFNNHQPTKIFYSIFDAKPSKIYNEWIKINSTV